ncbi:alkaline-phosphatase-like protein [Mycena rosella]|uniref:Alkaline-phosphatase-like protein n=1 Tax=Mycena rosella TaxID=1033263 RepID=A0AAD7AZW9_MYCRO|nr:alkaline-phosphatase-like protein [Mycena rosella]
MRHTRFLLDLAMHTYMNSTWTKNMGEPGDAVAKDVPFFIPVAPITPHAQFIDTKALLPELDTDTVAYNDTFYVACLQLVAGIDEMIGNMVAQLDAVGLLESTHIVFSADNGYHIGQHRLQPGEACPIEEDYTVPLIICGPNVPAEQMHGLELRPEFDGAAIPLTAAQIYATSTDTSKAEHIDMEYWDFIDEANEGNSGPLCHSTTRTSPRALSEKGTTSTTLSGATTRDMNVDQYQMNNMLVGYTFDTAGDLTSTSGLSAVASSTAEVAVKRASVTDNIPSSSRACTR